MIATIGRKAGQRREQRLRLGDLRHCRRRGKTFEGRREGVVRLDRTAGRLAELGERKRSAKGEAARALMLRDCDGLLERLLGRFGVGGIALEQHFATDAVQFGVERAMTDPFGRRERFVENCEGAVEVACMGFGFSQSNLDEPVEGQNVLFAQEVYAATHLFEPAAWRNALNLEVAVFGRELKPSMAPARPFTHGARL